MARSATIPDRWLRRYHESPDEAVRMICFPHAGGSAGFYFPYSAALAPEVGVLSVQYPGRQDRLAEPPVDSIAELADRLAEVVEPVADRPTAFFGHSMGAIVAYEVALRLRRTGAPPLRRLFVSGRNAPSRECGTRIHAQGEPGVLRDVRLLAGTEADVLHDPALLELIMPALMADYRAIETYRHQPADPLDCPVTALLGDADPRASTEAAAGWQEHTNAGFTARVFPGGHFYLLPRQDEVVRTVAAALRGARPSPPATGRPSGSPVRPRHGTI